MAKLPPIVQEFRARAELSQIIATARVLASHLAALADDLVQVQEEPGDGLTEYEVRLKTTSFAEPPPQTVRALECVAEDGWVVFYVPGPKKVAFYSAASVESVRRLA